RQEGGGGPAHALRHHPRVPARLQPARSGRVAHPARVPRAGRRGEGQGRRRARRGRRRARGRRERSRRRGRLGLHPPPAAGSRPRGGRRPHRGPRARRPGRGPGLGRGRGAARASSRTKLVMRLQKFLAQSGVASRRAAEKLIAEGKVKVNGVAVAALGTQVDPRKDKVELKGQRLRPEAPQYRLLLKPRACLATLDERDAERPTLARYVEDREVGWKVVAPLEFPAEGVVLLTTDGELAERMS